MDVGRLRWPRSIPRLGGMLTLTADQLLAHIQARAGLRSRERTERLTRAALSLLGGCLSGATREALREDLPDVLRDALPTPSGPSPSPLDLDDLVSRLSEHLELRRSVALEGAVAVGQSLAEAMDDDALRRIRTDLGDGDIARLLTRPEPLAPAPPHLHPERRTLAEGAPGSTHPLSTARPDRTHSESVVASDNPHGDTKLSSGRRR